MKLSQFKYTFFVVCILVFFNQNLLAQSTPKYSNEFLSIGVGARSFGMANSVVA